MRSGRTGPAASALLATVLALSPQPPRGVYAAALQPRIANGVLTANHPAVGSLLLLNPDGSHDSCTGTMIGCATFLTAAHCVCPDTTNTADQCLNAGLADPSNLVIFLQHAGQFGVSSIAVSPEYNFPIGDIALLTLSTPSAGVAPAAINTAMKPLPGTQGTIVGFGITGLNDRAGIKRQGKVVTSACPVDLGDDGLVCWRYLEPLGVPGENSDTCAGDSGGPLFVDFGAGQLLAGITSGGSDNCTPPDDSFDGDVFANRTFVQSEGGADLANTRCGNLPQVGEPPTMVTGSSGELGLAQPEQRFSFDVSPGMTAMRVSMNAESTGAANGTDFDLYLRYQTAPTTIASEDDCADESDFPFGFCEIQHPAAGTWHVLVNRYQGSGLFQLTVTTFASTCAGDCNGDSEVTEPDLVAGLVPAIFGTPAAIVCPVLTEAGTARDLVAGVMSVGDGCTASPPTSPG